MTRLHGLSSFSLVVALAAVPAQATTLDTAMRFDIAAGDLRSGLSAFSRASGVQVVVPPAAAANQQTSGVTGEHKPREALAMLLRGTGLQPSVTGEVVVLKPGPIQRRAPIMAAALTTDSAPSGGRASAEPGIADGGPDIVVSGYRASLSAAEAYKRRAVGSEDDIVAQDIAAFPDLNLAESLQRIPGITITRDSGEGRQITLRGLGPDFTRTQLNGMEVLGNTASGMDNRGAVSRSRSFDFSLFASELFNRVAVQKSYAAEQDEGGIAGTVQLTTAKPFDYDGSKFVISAKGQTNTNTSGVTPRVVALASNRWGDFGALISVAYSEIKSNEYGYRNWGWNTATFGAANIGPNIDAATRAKLLSGTVYVPQAESPSTWTTDRRRLGVTAALQYHPADTIKIDTDLLYGRLWDHRDDYALATAGTNALTGSTITGTQVIQSATITDNTLRAATYTGVDLRSEHHIIENHTDFYQGVTNATWT